MAGRLRKASSALGDRAPPPTSEQASIDRLWRASIWGIAVTALALGSFAALERVAADNLQPLEGPRSSSGGSASSNGSDSPFLGILNLGLNERGAGIASAVCAGCHGDGKKEPRSGVPNLAGQKAQAIYKQLIDFQSGERLHPQMEAVARALEIAELANAAAFYASRPERRFPPALEGSPEIERLATVGDKKRGLPACIACHGGRDTDPAYAPVLAGQPQSYLLAQLDAFASGQRKNDVSALMRRFAGKLTPQERVELARYFHGDPSGLGSKAAPRPVGKPKRAR